MGRRCRSWRYHVVPEHAGHQPGGKCRRCWTPCRTCLTKEQWAAGTRRCEACVDALLQSPEVSVRRTLVEEPGQSEAVLRALLTDPNGPIALAAERALSTTATDCVHSTVDSTVNSTQVRSVW
jgi:hypothetical protein